MTAVAEVKQLLGAGVIGICVLALLAMATSIGAAQGNRDADRQAEAERAEHNERRDAELQRQHRVWARVYAPPFPVTDPSCHVPAEAAPLTTVQPRRARHRKGQTACT
ncbi:hypothetical protein [Streptomyces fructofermentans]|uniref:hypothetical protein n=1 Tax=Streptomyces fructofermentans TaxID=152141 RepID=UPI001678DA2D|nr:hypothetical protein [Streptomyces fructofermentans]